MNRRHSLQTAAMGTVVGAVSLHLPESLFANPYGKPIGLQLYTLRDALEQDAAGTIQQVEAVLVPAQRARIVRRLGLEPF